MGDNVNEDIHNHPRKPQPKQQWSANGSSAYRESPGKKLADEQSALLIVNYLQSAICSKLWRAAAVCLMVAPMLSGCRKAQEPSAEQKAIARHRQEARQGKEWQAYFKNPESARTLKAAGLLETLGNNGQLPGISQSDTEILGFDLKMPVINPKGTYYWSQEFHVVIKATPPKHCHFVVVQTYTNSDFQLQKAWRSDGAGKVLEEYPIMPPPVMADARLVFLGPDNPGAERAWSGWYYGTLGRGSAGIDRGDPASGLNCFTIGITNAVPGATHHADFRSEPFPLGRTGQAHQPMTLSFAYKIPNKVKSGENIEIFLRFFDRKTNFLDQQVILVGSKTADSEMTEYKTMTLTNILAPSKAANADIWVTANLFDAPWTSGPAQFDDFSVTALSPRLWPISFATLIGAGAFAALAILLIWAFFARQSRNLTARSGAASA